ncbi:MAG TPA: hypothetical protein VG325_02890 [Solirubrobacteraceae bacterium]|nr:hypothetical protein [Solirubrobacteraceae bacterium]
MGGAALAGASVPPIIATARPIWTVVAGEALTRTGHALNAALADAAQITSPLMVAGVALLVSAEFALALLVAGAVSAAGMVAVGTDGGAPPAPPPSHLRRAPRFRAGLRAIVIGDLALGAWTAGLEVTVTAAAASRGVAELAAVPLTASAFGSIAVSLWSGTGRSTRPPAWRYLGGWSIVVMCLPFTLLASSVAAWAVVLVVVGAGFGLLNVAVFELLDHLAPPARAAEAFTWLTTANAAGTAVGAAACGRLAQTGTRASLVLVAGFAGAGTVIAVSRRGALRQ